MKTKMKPISTAIVGRNNGNNGTSALFLRHNEINLARVERDNLARHDEMKSMKMPILVHLNWITLNRLRHRR